MSDRFIECPTCHGKHRILGDGCGYDGAGNYHDPGCPDCDGQGVIPREAFGDPCSEPTLASPQPERQGETMSDLRITASDIDFAQAEYVQYRAQKAERGEQIPAWSALSDDERTGWANLQRADRLDAERYPASSPDPTPAKTPKQRTECPGCLHMVPDPNDCDFCANDHGLPSTREKQSG